MPPPPTRSREVEAVYGITIDVVIVVGGTSFDGVGLKEAAKGGHIEAGSHFDDGCASEGVVSASFLLAKPFIVVVASRVVGEAVEGVAVGVVGVGAPGFVTVGVAGCGCISMNGGVGP